MKLIVAEKPSVARILAKAADCGKKQKGYYEGKEYLVSWCIGHLVESAMPHEYGEKWKKWSLDELPILPAKWKYHVKERGKVQFSILNRLMKRDDIEEIVCATDAGREGELIFRHIYRETGCRKPVKRLWISSLEKKTVERGLQELQSSEKYDNLYRAALAREKADWIVGINASRLFSLLYRQPFRVGRVMTPTLNIVCQRETEREQFQPVPFYCAEISFGVLTAKSERFYEKEQAENCLDSCYDAKAGTVTSVKISEKTEKPPVLYDLTALQRDANKKFGFSPQKTMECAQSLYENRRITYPRTDSGYLTSDMEESTKELAESLLKEYGKEGQLKDVQVKRLLNDGKVRDHHGILPTKESIAFPDRNELKQKSEEEKIFSLILLRLLEAVSSECLWEEKEILIHCGNSEFSCRKKKMIYPGWRVFSGKEVQDEDKSGEEADDIFEGQILALTEGILKEDKTSPPPSFTEGSLLHEMEKAGKSEDFGLGTPATRSGILEKLIQSGYLNREGKGKTKILKPTEKAIQLITVLPEEIKSPSLTAEWEKKLKLIEDGAYSAEDFLTEIQNMIYHMTESYQKALNSSGSFASDSAP